MSKYQEKLNKMRMYGGYLKENALGKVVVDLEKTQREYDVDCLILQEAIDITNKIKNYVLYLENVRIEYYNKYANCLNNTNHNDSKYWDGMHFSVLSCINDLKRIVGDKNE